MFKYSAFPPALRTQYFNQQLNRQGFKILNYEYTAIFEAVNDYFVKIKELNHKSTDISLAIEEELNFKLFHHDSPIKLDSIHQLPTKTFDDKKIQLIQAPALIDENLNRSWILLGLQTSRHELSAELSIQLLPGSQYETYPVRRAWGLPRFFEGNETWVEHWMLTRTIHTGEDTCQWLLINRSLVWRINTDNLPEDVDLIALNLVPKNSIQLLSRVRDQLTENLFVLESTRSKINVSPPAPWSSQEGVTDFYNKLDKQAWKAEEQAYLVPRPNKHTLTAILNHMVERGGFSLPPNAEAPSGPQPQQPDTEDDWKVWGSFPLPNRTVIRSSKTGAPIVNNPEQQEQLETLGYTTQELLSEQHVQELRAYFTANFQETGPNFHNTAAVQSVEKRLEITTFIMNVIRPSLEQFLSPQVEWLAGMFLNKGFSESPLEPHQDWNCTDERRLRSYALWIPLVDVEEQNGGLSVLEGSHRYGPRFRSFTMRGVMADVTAQIWSGKAMTPIPLKAGQAILFDHALVHGSSPNRSQQLRPVVLVDGIKLKGYPYYFPFWQEGPPAHMSLYNFDEERRPYYQAGDNPEAYGFERIAHFPYPSQNLDAELLYQLYPLADAPAWTRERMAVYLQDQAQVVSQVQATDLSLKNSKEEPYTAELEAERQHSLEIKDSPEYIAWKNRTFWQTYTPLNIYREIRNRIFGAPQS